MLNLLRHRYLALIADALRQPVRRRRATFTRRPAAEPRSGPLDAEDSARLLAGFHGLPNTGTPTLHYVRSSADGAASAYAWDEDSGMVYILD